MAGICSWHGADENHNLFEEPQGKKPVGRPAKVERIQQNFTYPD